MSKSKRIIVTIKKVNFSGKWVEFWFEEGRLRECEYNGYHECCKSNQLHSLIKEEWISDIWTNGLKGYRMEWKEVGEYNEVLPVRLFKPKKK